MNAPFKLQKAVTSIPAPYIHWTDVPAHLKWRLVTTYMSIFAENIWRCLCKPIFFIVLGLLLAALGVVQYLNGWVRVGLLLGFAIWIVRSLIMAFYYTFQVNLFSVMRRLEIHNNVQPGSFIFLADKAVGTDSMVFWAAAQAKIQQKQITRSTPLPALTLTRQHIGLMAAIVVLLLYVTTHYKTAESRLTDALSPWPTSLAALHITAQIEPPIYTGLPGRQMLLKTDSINLVQAPQNSIMVININDMNDMHITGPDEPATFANIPGGAVGHVILRHSGQYYLKHGWRTIANIDVTLVADAAPSVAFTGVPELTASQSVDIGYSVSDDYGAEAVGLAIQVGTATEAVLLNPPSEPQALVHSFRDLTSSRFAGEKVILQLVAIDHANNYGLSNRINFTLPERHFLHPVAQQIIAIRKQLFVEYPNFKRIEKELDDVSQNLKAYDGRYTVFAALRSAVWRLRGRAPEEQIGPLVGWLWQIALDLDKRVQGPNVSALRQQFDDLMAQMNSGADTKEQMKKLEDAMQQFMQGAGVERAAPQAGQNSKSISAATLNQMMQQLRERLAVGDKAGAKEIAEALQHIMENVRGGGSGKVNNNTGQMMRQLQNVSGSQQSLMGETAGENIGNAFRLPHEQGNGLKSLADKQQNLTEQLQHEQKNGGDKVPGVKSAREAMDKARQALDSGDGAAALKQQAQAMNSLQKAIHALKSNAKEQGEGASETEGDEGLDPLGRLSGGRQGRELPLPGGHEVLDIAKIKHILEERAADPARTPAEKAYILRLLRRF